MRLEAEAGGRRERVAVRGADGRYEVTLGDRHLVVDARRRNERAFSLLIEGRSHDVLVEPVASGYRVHLGGRTVDVTLHESSAVATRGAGTAGPLHLVAPMPGKVVRVLVAPGAAVEAGAGLVVVEAMKMENELKAARAGRVRAVHVAEGQAVDAGAPLLELD
jgi:biotin carboxyl carrier protein